MHLRHVHCEPSFVYLLVMVLCILFEIFVVACMVVCDVHIKHNSIAKLLLCKNYCGNLPLPIGKVISFQDIT